MVDSKHFSSRYLKIVTNRQSSRFNALLIGLVFTEILYRQQDYDMYDLIRNVFTLYLFLSTIAPTI